MGQAERQAQHIAPRYIEQNGSSSFCGSYEVQGSVNLTAHEAALVGKAGEALVAGGLLRRHIDVAHPAHDGGIDLLAYRSHDLTHVIPIQVKTRTSTCYEFQKDWFRIPGLVLIQVRYVGETPEFYIFGGIDDVESALGPQHVASPSWTDRGMYNVTMPNEGHLARMWWAGARSCSRILSASTACSQALWNASKTLSLRLLLLSTILLSDCFELVPRRIVGLRKNACAISCGIVLIGHVLVREGRLREAPEIVVCVSRRDLRARYRAACYTQSRQTNQEPHQTPSMPNHEASRFHNLTLVDSLLKAIYFGSESRGDDSRNAQCVAPRAYRGAQCAVKI
jgi:hypothetical protein